METHREGTQDAASQIEVKTKTGAATEMTAEAEEWIKAAATSKATGEEMKPNAQPKRKRTYQTKREPIKPKLKTGADFELGLLMAMVAGFCEVAGDGGGRADGGVNLVLVVGPEAPRSNNNNSQCGHSGSRSAVGCRVVLRDQLLSGGVEV